MTMHVTNPHIVRYVCVKRYVSMLRELVLPITSERNIRRQRSKNQPQEIHCTERASVRMFTAHGKIVFYANGRHRIFVSLEHMSASKKKMNGAEALRIGSKWQSLNYKQMKRQSESLFHSYAKNLMPSFSGRLVCERTHKPTHTRTNWQHSFVAWNKAKNYKHNSAFSRTKDRRNIGYAERKSCMVFIMKRAVCICKDDKVSM